MRKVLTAMNVVLRATESQNRAFSEADVDTFVKNPSPSPSPSPNPKPKPGNGCPSMWRRPL